MNIFVYPGSFDPITRGHLDIIHRGAQLCDRLIVAVLKNSSKNSLLSKDDRVELIQKCIKDLPNVEVMSFDGLLVDFCESQHAGTIIRGLRAVTDFEYELQMAFLNKQMNPHIETCFLMASQKYSFLSSSVVRDIASYGGNIGDFVPEEIIDDVLAKYYKDKNKLGGTII